MSDYDMNSDEGDGDCVMECTFQFDDVEIDSQQQRRRTGGYFGGSQAKVQ